jgi:hypothetical protein
MTQKAPPLILEDIEANNNGYLTLIIYKKQKYLVVVDNVHDEEVSAFVLDRAEAEGVDTAWFISVCNLWFYKSSDQYPLSFEFAKMGNLDKVKSILKTFPTSSISRIVGRIFMFNINQKPKVKRRKVVPIPSYVEVKLKKT